MYLLALIQDYGLKPVKKATTRGGEYSSACPNCGGSKRFIIHPDYEGGKYFCRECSTSGDTIQFLIDFKGMTFKEAAEKTGKAIDNDFSRRRYVLPTEKAPELVAVEKLNPAQEWKREAAAEMAKAHNALLDNKERLAWLANRGLDLKAVKDYKLGWIEEPKYYSLKKWGLSEEENRKGNKKKLWLPKGYLIPQLYLKNQIIMLQIRMDELLPNNKMRYYPVKGSTVTPMIIKPNSAISLERIAWVIVESRLDALLIARYAGDLVGVMAQGNNSANPCPAAILLLDASPCILNALDFDEAGAAAYKKWAKRFKTVRRWPVPESKDPGEYVENNNGNIRAWILAGLPPGLRFSHKKEIEKPVVDTSPDIDNKQDVKPICTAIETKCKRLVHITKDREIYQKLEAEGKIVFSEKEVNKVTAFQKDGGEPSLLIDIKEIFIGSKITGRIKL